MMRFLMKIQEKFTQIHDPISSIGSEIVPHCSLLLAQNQYNELVCFNLTQMSANQCFCGALETVCW